MALGASPRAMTGMIVRDALGMVLAGLALGVPVAFWSKRFAASVFGGLTVNDSKPMLVGALVMLAVGLLAAYLPGRRAGAIDPIEALRRE
jgi:ABC-type antimicrobial peptide transport system permease subunit